MRRTHYDRLSQQQLGFLFIYCCLIGVDCSEASSSLLWGWLW